LRVSFSLFENGYKFASKKDSSSKTTAFLTVKQQLQLSTFPGKNAPSKPVFFKEVVLVFWTEPIHD